MGGSDDARLLVVSISCLRPAASRLPADRSLKNHDVDVEVKGMFDMATETMKLPLEEKLKFEQGDDGQSFG